MPPKSSKSFRMLLGSLNHFVAHREITKESALHAPRNIGALGLSWAGVILGKEDEAIKPELKTALVPGIRAE